MTLNLWTMVYIAFRLCILSFFFSSVIWIHDLLCHIREDLSDILLTDVVSRSGFCTMAVCCIDGRIGLSYTPSNVQSAEDRGDIVLQHGSYQAAVVQDMGGYRGSFQ